jgi:demethylspheroidene O-methyltransferase
MATELSRAAPLDRWYRLRDRLLSSPDFQRWAAAFPLTRPFARKRAGALFDICAGFVYSQILAAAVRLGVFEALAEQPKGAVRLAPELGLTVEHARRLLDACVALRLLERRSHERYGLAVLGAAFLGNPSLSRMVEHHALLYADLADPVALLRGPRPQTRLERFWAYATSEDARDLSDDQVAAYSELMAETQALIAEDVVEAYPLHRHRRLLDVAGGEGAFLEAVGQRVAGLELALFELPAVAARAERRLAHRGLAPRSHAYGGDLFRDALPPGADVISLVRVIHDHDDAEAMRILRSVRSALAPDGVLLIAEPMSGTPGAEAMGDAYFGFFLLAMGKGKPRTADRLSEMAQCAGFARCRRIRTRRPLLTTVLAAEAV